MNGDELRQRIRMCQRYGDPVVIRGGPHQIDGGVLIDLMSGPVTIDAMGADIRGCRLAVRGQHKPPLAWRNRLTIFGGMWTCDPLMETPWLSAENLCGATISPESVDGYKTGVSLSIKNDGWCENNMIGGAPWVSHLGCEIDIALNVDPGSQWKSYAGTRIDNIHVGPCSRIVHCEGRMYDSWITRVRGNTSAVGENAALFEFVEPLTNVQFEVGVEGEWDGTGNPAVILGVNSHLDPGPVRWGLRRGGKSIVAAKYMGRA